MKEIKLGGGKPFRGVLSNRRSQAVEVALAAGEAKWLVQPLRRQR